MPDKQRLYDGIIHEMNIGIAKSENIEQLYCPQPTHAVIDTWVLKQAIRYTIGWFDYSDTATTAGFTDSDGDGLDTDAPVADAAKLLRHLAVVLQPPLLVADGSNNVLEWPSPLLPYQRKGVMALTQRKYLLLADSMGLGKTIQAISALRILIHQKSISNNLVVCPAALLTQWRIEFMRWAPELRTIIISGDSSTRGHLWRLPVHVKLISYETLRTDVLDLRDSPALKHNWDVVVLDEASRIKNRQSAVSVACKLLRRDRRWALTGTPIENKMDDAVSILEFLIDDPEEPSSLGILQDDEIKSRLGTYQLRRRREDVLPQLPPKYIHDIHVDLSPRQREAYDKAELDGIVRLSQSEGTVTVIHILELISRLKQICNADPISGESAKLEDIKDRMRDISGDNQRALVFSQFTDSTFGIGYAARYLSEFSPLLYTGQLSQRQRIELIERFIHHNEHKALLLSLRAGAYGLNLQAASYIFHLDRWWNPAVEEQADSRAHRLGQTYPVTIYRYICTNTIEERIDKKLQEKRQLFNEVVDDISMDLTKLLTESEVFDLVGIRRK